MGLRILAASLAGLLAAAQGSTELQERIEFLVTTVQETGGTRSILSQARISGPPDTDFDIRLRGSRLEMTARFLTDLQGDGTLLVRTRLQIRRLYGVSERGLPLYEEDRQRQTLQMSFDEQIVLLPFGPGGDERLLIEVTPTRTRRPPGPPTIDILKVSPGGQVYIEAHQVPHHYQLHAALLKDGNKVAESVQQLLIEEQESIRLNPSKSSAAPQIGLELTIDRYESGGPGRVAFHFDVLRADTPLARNWAGIIGLGSSHQYPLSLKEGEYTIELRFELMKDE
ncbi:MAG: hypothetical protein V3T83_15920 [Acidobacteriota bacterium]